MCLVEVFDHFYLVLLNFLEKVESCGNRRTLLKCGLLTE